MTRQTTVTYVFAALRIVLLVAVLRNATRVNRDAGVVHVNINVPDVANVIKAMVVMLVAVLVISKK